MKFSDPDADARFLSFRITRVFALMLTGLAVVGAVALATDRRHVWPGWRWNTVGVVAVCVAFAYWAAPRVSRRLALAALALAIAAFVAEAALDL